VFRADDQGRVMLQDAWPPRLPPLPEGAHYAPRSRVRSLRDPIPERSTLGHALVK
jgi:hypothetical protein